MGDKRSSRTSPKTILEGFQFTGATNRLRIEASTALERSSAPLRRRLLPSKLIFRGKNLQPGARSLQSFRQSNFRRLFTILVSS